MEQDNSIFDQRDKRTVRNLSYKLLCKKCKKRYIKSVLPTIRRYVREHPRVPVVRIAAYYGIPRTCLLRALERGKESEHSRRTDKR